MELWISIIGLTCSILIIILALVKNPLQNAINDIFFTFPIVSLICFVFIAFACLCGIYRYYYPPKSTYEKVQNFRDEQDYYISNGDEWVGDTYGLDDENDTFSYQDMVDAYNSGLEDGIEQTIEYFEYNED